MLFDDTVRGCLTLGLLRMLNTKYPNPGELPLVSTSNLTDRQMRREELEELLWEVTDTKGWLNALNDCLAKVIEDVRLLENKTRWLMVPIHGLPRELVVRIFSHVHESSSSSMSSVPLSHVCSQWRRIALGCPELWTKVDLSTNSAQYVLDEFARRSCRKSLRLLSCSGLNPKVPIRVSPKVAERTISLHIKLHPDRSWAMHSLAVLIDWPNDSAAILPDLFISAKSETSIGVMGLPRSRALALYRVALSADLSEFPSSEPAHNLRVLRIYGMSSAHCRNLFEALKPGRLDRLTMDVIHDVKHWREGLPALAPHACAPKVLSLNQCGAQICSPNIISLRDLTLLSIWNSEAGRSSSVIENAIALGNSLSNLVS